MYFQCYQLKLVTLSKTLVKFRFDSQSIFHGRVDKNRGQSSQRASNPINDKEFRVWVTFAAQFEASGQHWIVVTSRCIEGGHDEGGGDEGVNGGGVFGLQISQIPAKMISRKICVAGKCIFYTEKLFTCWSICTRELPHPQWWLHRVQAPDKKVERI